MDKWPQGRGYGVENIPQDYGVSFYLGRALPWVRRLGERTSSAGGARCCAAAREIFCCRSTTRPSPPSFAFLSGIPCTCAEVGSLPPGTAALSPGSAAAGGGRPCPRAWRRRGGTSSGASLE